jgi:dTDP-4-amino-4,6-dideoxygalactose transaminase
VVEDAAHAFGARLDGAPAGTFGRLAAFSLYPTKVLTSAEGGILTGASGRELALARRLRDHGRTEYSAIRHDCLGGNWRLSELHASVGAAQLERFAGMHAARHRLAARYDAKLAGLPRLRRYELPASVETNYYKYLVYLDDGVDRADLKRRLRDRYGIVLSGEVYDAILCDQPYFAGGKPAGGKPAGAEFADRYPNARWFAERHACLPLYPGLTEAEQDRVVAALRAELS